MLEELHAILYTIDKRISVLVKAFNCIVLKRIRLLKKKKIVCIFIYNF